MKPPLPPKELRQEWSERLAQSGFKDIEDQKENLKNYDRRTIAFENRDLISKFFTTLDHYLTEHPDLPPGEKEILTRYSEGIYLKQISRELNLELWIIKKVVKKYKILISDLI